MYYRRHLPHWIPEQRAVFVTWRLAGSNPPQPTRTSPDKGTFLTHDDEPHVAGSGPVWLRDPRVTGMVVSALRHGEALRQLYRLHTFVVMPNHVHVVWEPLTPMPKIMQWLKGRTGRMANRILGRPGMAFWQRRVVRPLDPLGGRIPGSDRLCGEQPGKGRFGSVT